jgi:CRISPR-associated protein Cas2
MSRNRFVVCYDVRDPARLRRTHRTMLGYGDPLQYSVFLCELSRAERILMETALRRVVALREDSVVIIDLGPASGPAARRITQLGVGRIPRPERGLVI